MARETILTDFRPSVHGFPFRNSWRDTVVGAVPSRGRCGGMVFAALDHYLAGERLESDDAAGTMPDHDSRIAHYIWRRQIASFSVSLGRNPVRFLIDTLSPSPGRFGVAARSRAEIEPLLKSLRDGVPAPVGLIATTELKRIARNHQVLAWGAEITELLATVHIYDPNLPGRDDIVLELPLYGDGMVIERIGEKRKAWRGMFVARYAPINEPAEEIEVDPRGIKKTGGIAALVVAVGVIVLGIFGLTKRRRKV